MHSLRLLTQEAAPQQCTVTPALLVSCNSQDGCLSFIPSFSLASRDTTLGLESLQHGVKAPVVLGASACYRLTTGLILMAQLANSHKGKMQQVFHETPPLATLVADGRCLLCMLLAVWGSKDVWPLWFSQFLTNSMCVVYYFYLDKF